MNIRLNSVKANDSNLLTRKYLYKDLKLDLQTGYSLNSQLLKDNEVRDLQTIYDIDSIRNSIINCLLTMPGQKILNPEFGIDLRQYLFDPVDSFTSLQIQDDISLHLPTMEPRIVVENVAVLEDIDNQEYVISLTIDVPSLNVYGLSLQHRLQSNGYTNII